MKLSRKVLEQKLEWFHSNNISSTYEGLEGKEVDITASEKQ
jgi:hypothetical protein